MKPPCFFIGLLLFFFSCSSQKYSANNLPAKQIRFGEGGGFTGAVEAYCLLDNGQVFSKKTFSEEMTAIKKVKKKQAKKCFKIIEKLGIEKMNLNKPGDKYFFIAYKTKDIDHRITWGSNTKEIPAAIDELYLLLNSLIKKEEELK